MLSGIQQAELCSFGTTLSMAKHGNLVPDHILHGQLAGSLDMPNERLKFRRLFMAVARKLLNDLFELGIRAAQRTNISNRAQVF